MSDRKSDKGNRAREGAGNPGQKPMAFERLPFHFHKYRIETFLARGGMGEVYYAIEMDLDRPVVVKILTYRSGDEEDYKRRFHREALAASRVFHPNVATIFEVGETRGLSFIAMEYVAGENIDRAFAKIDLALGDVLDIFRQIVEGLEACHDKQIFHRDIKPSNISLTTELVPKILDFGVAKIETSMKTDRDTSQLQVVGTISYMAPEQARGEEVTAAADIFSLGITFYELLTGEFPYGEKGRGLDYVLERQRLNYLPPPPSTRIASLPPELDHILLKMLQPRVEDRYQETHRLLADLARLSDQMHLRRVLAKRPPLEKARWFLLCFLLPLLVSLILLLGGWLLIIE